MAIQYLEKSKTWILGTKQADYVFRLTDAGQVVHCYWGEKQQIADYERQQGSEHWHRSPSVDSTKDEIMPWGGLRLAEPGLKVTFADHARDLCLRYDGYRMIDDHHLVISLIDQMQSAQVHLHYLAYEEFDLIERYVEITNAGAEPFTIERVMGAIWHMPMYPEYNLTYLTGHWNAEFQVRREPLQEGKKVLESREGVSGHFYNSWFAIDFGDATEDHGKVYFGAIACSGNWKLIFEKTLRQSLQIAAGLNDFDFAWTLKPGETFTSPVCVGGFTSNGLGQASRNMHQYQLKHVLRRADEPRPLMYNTWYATKFDIDEERLKALASKAAQIGAEIFVVDDGWFGDSRTERARLGDWKPDPGKFPNGLKPLIDHVTSLGMRFGVWVEPENVGPDSNLYKEHPDWIYHFPGRNRTHLNNEFTLNLAREDVRDYVFKAIDQLLSANDITYVKWDMNRYFSEPGWPVAPAEHHKEIWVRHTRGLYSIIEALREKHPNVWFESCASGGGRTDLEALKHFEQVWTSDNTDGFDRLFIQEGFSFAYTPKAMMCWVAPPARFRPRSTSLKYRFHCAMMGSFGVSLDLTKYSDSELDEMRQYVELYKSIRDTVQNGALYRLTSPRSPYGTAVQYVNEKGTQVVLFAFRHSQQYVHPVYPIRLKGLDPAAEYVDAQSGAVRSGASLMAVGLQLGLKGDFDSALVVLNKAE